MKEKMTLPQGFSAGYGRITANPQIGCSLCGFGNDAERISTDRLDDIAVTCTAFSDGEKVFLLCSCDVLLISTDIFEYIADAVWERYGIPAEHLVINATHTHSAPSVIYPKAVGMDVYRPFFFDALLQAIRTALEDLSPAAARMTRTRTPGLNYVRRYLSKKDGSFIGNWPSPQDLDEAFHETDADEEMRILLFVREGKKDILMVNWQCHACTSRTSESTLTQISAEWITTFRSVTEEKLGVHFTYHQGAAGNLISATQIVGEKSNLCHKRIGRELALLVKQALECTVPVESTPFRAHRVVWEQKRNACWMERMGVKKDTEPLPLSTLAMGEIAFATVPCEWHDTCGRAVRELSPFQMTFVCGYTNGSVSYIPAAFCWENGGYEVTKCHFDKGLGEEIALHHVNTLRNFYGRNTSEKEKMQ